MVSLGRKQPLKRRVVHTPTTEVEEGTTPTARVPLSTKPQMTTTTSTNNVQKDIMDADEGNALREILWV